MWSLNFPKHLAICHSLRCISVKAFCTCRCAEVNQQLTLTAEWPQSTEEQELDGIHRFSDNSLEKTGWTQFKCSLCGELLLTCVQADVLLSPDSHITS